MQHAYRFIQEFEASVETEQLIPAGAPIDFVPERNQ
jgi:arylsulfatase